MLSYGKAHTSKFSLSIYTIDTIWKYQRYVIDFFVFGSTNMRDITKRILPIYTAKIGHHGDYYIIKYISKFGTTKTRCIPIIYVLRKLVGSNNGQYLQL